MKTYQEIISVVRGDITKLEAEIVKDLDFPDDSLKELLLGPAKRIRPALAFLFLRANGQDVTDEHLAFQTAIELAHTASLIHDDIIDESILRRGKQTLSAKFGDKTAVLTGDYILSRALKRIISMPQTLNAFLDTFSEMAQGEINQQFSRFQIPALEDYLHKTIQKTAGLFALALNDTSRDFGLNFGIAFQIKNDLKDIDDDIKNGIYTAPVIFSGGIEITSNALSETKNIINSYLEKAGRQLDTLPQNKYSDALKELLELYKEC